MIDCDTTKKICAATKDNLERGTLVLDEFKVLQFVGVFGEKIHFFLVIHQKVALGADETTLKLKLHFRNV